VTPQIGSFALATADYEAWLDERISLVPQDVADKHSQMASALFPFLRATFYRWAQLWPLLQEEGLESLDAPEVLAVGDLHMENFGTWRDAEARLVWGINDFDEACRMPYSIDLVRLAASVFLAIDSGQLGLGHQEAAEAIRTGYREGLVSGGSPFVLGESHGWLLDLVRPARPANFWEKMLSLKEFSGKVPKAAVKGLERLLPGKNLEYRLAHRVAGLGSRGRQRFVAIADFEGGHVCREAKELTTSAWWWARKRQTDAGIRYQDALDRAVRARDPFVRARSGWVVRRLAPDCAKIALADVPKDKEKDKLLHAMGREAANVHLGSGSPRAIVRDLDSRGKQWLHDAAGFMVHATRADWEEWKKSAARAQPPAPVPLKPGR